MASSTQLEEELKDGRPGRGISKQRLSLHSLP
eukprot:CAMPEP_0197698862 /NCGR_PEP_ID=MMETSP1338-20131121/119846_1 /TAXON_ID=43686 ORGANISM="Pelagodinium beii, Strain RCC1491" /NCGR_SAMPLE_ID=MMETSP1338 /ASSEMBLY_ACC=CAM_ASM_000754 /LENGTH=31 /DNA_ID= /DNA_START= /DNA_END= /DNA_ORIENTATION=